MSNVATATVPVPLVALGISLQKEIGISQLDTVVPAGRVSVLVWLPNVHVTVWEYAGFDGLTVIVREPVPASIELTSIVPLEFGSS